MNQTPIKAAETNNGLMLYPPADMYIGQAIEHYGEYVAAEQDFFRFAAQKGGEAIDAGANIGAHSMAMARYFERVMAFEPQRMLFKLLKANLSDWPSSLAYNAALGKEDGLLWLPSLNYGMTNNFGGVGRDCVENWSPDQREHIPMVEVQIRQLDKIDAVKAAEKISLIKVDVEGMEKEVLEGARQTIAKHQPILYVENDKPKKSQELVDFIYNGLGYRAWWHIPFLFNENNFNHNPVNIFDKMASFNLICIPDGHWLKVTGAQVCTPQNPNVPEGCKV